MTGCTGTWAKTFGPLLPTSLRQIPTRRTTDVYTSFPWFLACLALNSAVSAGILLDSDDQSHTYTGSVIMKMRVRTFSLLVLFLSMSLPGLTALAQPSLDDRPLANPPQGSLIGEYAARDERVAVFRGIPYAAPPVGQRRWQPPQPPVSWSGEREADSFGPNCMQQSYPQGSFFYRPARLSSEDCLYLNVWSKAAESDRKPVMV